MQQFGASKFYTVVRWHKLDEVDIESTLHNFIVLAIRVRKLSNLLKIWRSSDEKVGSFFGTPCIFNFQRHYVSSYGVYVGADIGERWKGLPWRLHAAASRADQHQWVQLRRWHGPRVLVTSS